MTCINRNSGPANPECPVGYVWGGLSCLREVEPQFCSDGWFWDGTKCVEGTDVVCAPGFSLSGGLCVECAIPAQPVFVVAPGSVTLNFSVAVGLQYNIFRSTDGESYEWLTSDVGLGGGDTFNDNTVTAGMIYFYYISVYLSAECGFIEGVVGSVIAA